MNDRLMTYPLLVSIAAIERDTGLSKDTLRVWERRYGFPQPQRDALGERAYPLHQLEKLRLIRRLLDAGFRPGKVVGQPVEQLEALLLGALPAAVEEPGQPLAHDTAVDSLMHLVLAHDLAGLRRSFAAAVEELGLAGFVVRRVVPMNERVGDAWMRGHLQIFEEHLYTEAVTMALRTAIHALPALPAGAAPRVVLTTIAQAPHALGLLMAEAMLALAGCYCIPLGVQLPLPDIVEAVRAHRADILALSFTASLNANDVLGGLNELRRALPDEVDIWAGGQCPVLQRRPPEGIAVLTDLASLASRVEDWRAGRASQARA